MCSGSSHAVTVGPATGCNRHPHSLGPAIGQGGSIFTRSRAHSDSIQRATAHPPPLKCARDDPDTPRHRRASLRAQGRHQGPDPTTQAWAVQPPSPRASSQHHRAPQWPTKRHKTAQSRQLGQMRSLPTMTNPTTNTLRKHQNPKIPRLLQPTPNRPEWRHSTH